MIEHKNKNKVEYYFYYEFNRTTITHPPGCIIF